MWRRSAIPDAPITLTVTPEQLAALRVAVGCWLNLERARELGYVDVMLDVWEVLGSVMPEARFLGIRGVSEKQLT